MIGRRGPNNGSNVSGIVRFEFLGGANNFSTMSPNVTVQMKMDIR